MDRYLTCRTHSELRVRETLITCQCTQGNFLMSAEKRTRSLSSSLWCWTLRKGFIKYVDRSPTTTFCCKKVQGSLMIERQATFWKIKYTLPFSISPSYHCSGQVWQVSSALQNNSFWLSVKTKENISVLGYLCYILYNEEKSNVLLHQARGMIEMLLAEEGSGFVYLEKGCRAGY